MRIGTRLVLLILFSLPLFSQYGIARKLLTGNGLPPSASCLITADVGNVWVRKDATSSSTAFYMCVPTGVFTYAWVLQGSGGGVTMSPYDVNFSGYTSGTIIPAITHGQGSKPVIECFYASGLASDCGTSSIGPSDGTVTWEFPVSFTGTGRITGGGSVTPYDVSLSTYMSGTTTTAATHGQGTKPYLECIYASGDTADCGTSFVNTTTGDVTWIFPASFTGIGRITGGGSVAPHDVTLASYQSGTTTSAATHGQGIRPLIECMYASGQIADCGTSSVNLSTGAVTWVFPAIFTGFGRIIGADAGVGGSSESSGGSTYIKELTVLDPVTGHSGRYQISFPSDTTITRVSCSVKAATSVTVNLDERLIATPDTAGTEVLASGLVCDTDSESSTMFTNADIAARVPVALTISAVSGVPDTLRVFVEYMVN